MTTLDQARFQARNAGLQRGITFAPLVAAIVNGVVGASIFTLPAAVAQDTGGLALLAYGLSAVIMAAITLCFAETASRVPSSGGVYAIIEEAFGPAWGFIAGMMLVLSNALANGGIAVAIADTVGQVAPGLAVMPGRSGLFVAMYGVLLAANLAGVRTAARVIAVSTLIKLLPLLLLIGLGVCFGHGPAIGAAVPGSGTHFGHGMILTVFAFMGMETTLSVSGEVARPQRTLPRALGVAMLAVLLIYVGVQISANRLLGGALGQSLTPLADAAGQVSPWARLILLSGAGVSMLAFLVNDVLATPRVIFAFARDGLLPRGLGQLTPRRHVPARAIWAYTLVGSLFALGGGFTELIVLSALAAVVIYVLVCLAALQLRRAKVALGGEPFAAPALPLVVLIGLSGMALLVASAEWREIAGMLAAMALSYMLYTVMLVLRRR